MCCTLATARLSNTILYAGEASRTEGTVHVLGYQNTVQDLSRIDRKARTPSKDWDYKKPFGSGGSGNAMILPFPAIPGSMGRENVLSTKQCPNILRDMAAALKPDPNTFFAGVRLSRSAVAKRVEIFEHDIYEIVLATNADLIPGVIHQVSENKRPPINTEVFNAYAELYRDWGMALCCFDNKDAKVAAPLLWWYLPMYPELLFAPGLDAHTGSAPDLGADVKVDHTVVVSSNRMHGGDQVHYTDLEMHGDTRSLLPSRIVGRRLNGTMQNGDFVCHLDDVDNGKFAPKRLLPPGVPRA